MKTVYMHQVYMGAVSDMKNLEQHYSEMAERGWLIDKIGLFTHRYRATEPCKKRFFVDFLPQITAFDYPENEDAQDYRLICEKSGWDFIAANKQFHVFCANAENPAPIPIHTDNSIHARIYLKACRKYELPVLLYALLMFWLFSPLSKGAELFLSNIYLLMTIGYSLFSIGYIWTLGYVVSWYIRTRKSAKNDLPMPIVNRRVAKLRNKILFAGAISLLVCMIIGVALEVIGGMLTKSLGLGLRDLSIYILIIPLANFGGLLFSRELSKKFADCIKKALVVLFAVIAVCSLLLVLIKSSQPALEVLMFAAISAMACGCNSILLSYIPLSFTSKNMVSTFVGVFDFSSYVGAACSTYALGFIIGKNNMDTAPLLWLVAGLVAVLTIIWSEKGLRRTA